jgi:hypothetical protein
VFDVLQFESQLCGVSRSGTARLSQRVREGMGGESACFSTDSLSGKFTETSKGLWGKDD